MSSPIPPQNFKPLNAPSGQINSAMMSEAHLAQFLKQNKRAIILAIMTLLMAGGIFEVKSYYLAEKNAQAQALFEQYLLTPDTETYKTLHQQFPNHIHTQLVALIEAKRCFEKSDFTNAKQYLAYVVNHAQNEGIRNLAIVRLSMVYRHTGDTENAQKIFEQVTNPTSHTQIYHSLTLPQKSEERGRALDEALSKADTTYSQQMINILQYHNYSKP